MIGHHTLIVQPGDRLEVRDKLGEKPGLTLVIGLDATLTMTTDLEEELLTLLMKRAADRKSGRAA